MVHVGATVHQRITMSTKKAVKKAPAKAPKKKLTVTEISKKGGIATLKKHGKQHYVAAARKRWDKKK